MVKVRGRASERLATVCRATNWDELVQLQRRFGEKGRWIYRGHRDVSWELETTLERSIRRFGIHRASLDRLEGGLIRQFARRAHHHLSDVPNRNQWAEWLALMQHHGSPTRLLDCSYSFFVGIFFALEEFEPGQECALWVINANWMADQVRRIVGKDAFRLYEEQDRNIEESSTFRQLLRNRVKMVVPLNPYRLNQRLSIQQGVFLCPADVSVPFVENLAALGKTKEAIIKCKINLTRRAYQDCVRKLIRMNMTRTSLFPGIDGFAASQKMALANPHILVPDYQWENGDSGAR